MSDEGKLARAMAKAGAAERLAAAPVIEAAAPRPAAPAAVRALETPSFRRVTGQWNTPDLPLVLYHERMGQIASQVRSLRAKIMALNNGRPPQVITVTSGSRGEGKTTVSLNLAAALSEIDSGRVLVIDGDMLHPALHMLARIKADTGLSDILSDNLSLDGNVYETAIPNLDIIPGMPGCVNMGYESQLHQRLRDLITVLRRYYAFIIIDTPPALAGSQAAAFGKNSDGVLLVARMETTPRQVVKRALDEMTNVGAQVIGCLLTHHEHHVPDVIYRLFGTTSSRYYNPSQAAQGAPVPESAPAAAAQAASAPGAK